MTFPFVVRSVDRERLGYWAEYAAGATTQSALGLLAHAYQALWWEMRAADHHQDALRLAGMRSVDVASLLAWLDLTVSSLSAAIERWEWAARGIEQAADPDWSAYGFVRDQAIVLQEVRRQVVGYVLSACEQYGFSVPEHCAAVLAA